MRIPANLSKAGFTTAIRLLFEYAWHALAGLVIGAALAYAITGLLHFAGIIAL